MFSDNNWENLAFKVALVLGLAVVLVDMVFLRPG